MGRHAVVIGRGLAGLAIAWELVRKNFIVTIAAPQDAVGDASKNAQGISSVKGLLFGRGDLFRAKLQGHRYLRSWISSVAEKSPIDIPYSMDGCWEPVANAEVYNAIRERVHKCSWSGAFGSSILPFPRGDFRSDSGEVVKWGFRHAFDGWIDVPLLMRGLEGLLIRLGVTFVGEKVASIKQADNGRWFIQGETAQSTFLCDELFVAAGFGTNSILRSLGIEFKTKEVPGGTLWWDGPWSARGSYLFGKRSFVVSDKGSWKFGSVDTKIPPLGDLERDELLKSLKAEALNSLVTDDRSLEKATLHWGTRVCSHDLLPIVGSLPLGSSHVLYVSTAFHKSGLQLAPLAAKVLVDSAIGIQSPEPWQSFAPTRSGIRRKASAPIS